MTRDSDFRLLIGALVLSILLHALMLFGNRFQFDSLAPARHSVIQATLRSAPSAAIVPPPPAQPAAPAAKERSPRPGAAAEQARVKPPSPAGTAAPPDAGKAGRAPEPERETEARERAPLAIAEPGAPEYPDEAVKRKLESCVLAAVLVSAGGEVESVRILHADVARIFDQSVIEAYSRARYIPAQSNGQNVPSRVLAVATFVLGPQRARPCAGRYAPAARRINALPLATEIDAAQIEPMLHGGR